VGTIPKKIYILYQRNENDEFLFSALAEDGTCLSSWTSASEENARNETKSPAMKEKFDAYYPKHDLVWRTGPIDHDTMASWKPVGRGATAFIEGQLYAEFLHALTVGYIDPKGKDSEKRIP